MLRYELELHIESLEKWAAVNSTGERNMTGFVMLEEARNGENAAQPLNLLLLPLHHAVTGECRSRVSLLLVHPLAHHVFVQIQIAGGL